MLRVEALRPALVGHRCIAGRYSPRLRHIVIAELHHRPRLEHDGGQAVAQRLGRCRLEQEFIGARARASFT